VNKDTKRVKEILAAVKPLAAEYYARGLALAFRPSYPSVRGAIRKTPKGEERIQIKGRAFGDNSKASQRVGTIKHGAACDKVLLVLLDNATLEPVSMWEAPYSAVTKRLLEPGSKARNLRGAMSVHDFKKIAQLIWPKPSGAVDKL
jgi:hypothetical protein